MTSPEIIQQRIDDHILATVGQEKPRPYLGASAIGEACLRKSWLGFRWVEPEKFPARLYRVFDRGHRDESQFVKWLRWAGFVVEASCEADEDQITSFQFKDLEKHFAGTCDGVARRADLPSAKENWFLLEFKDWKAETKMQPGNSFEHLRKVGVKIAAPKHYQQITAYLGELKMEWCLYCAVNKNTDELWFEWVQFDPQIFQEVLAKAEHIINVTVPPERISNDPNCYSCKYCHLSGICQFNHPITNENKHCRNCVHGHPAESGTWVCDQDKTFGTLCEAYQPVIGGAG